MGLWVSEKKGEVKDDRFWAPAAGSLGHSAYNRLPDWVTD